jgi:hypothetical protein
MLLPGPIYLRTEPMKHSSGAGHHQLIHLPTQWSDQKKSTVIQGSHPVHFKRIKCSRPLSLLAQINSSFICPGSVPQEGHAGGEASGGAVLGMAPCRINLLDYRPAHFCTR